MSAQLPERVSDAADDRLRLLGWGEVAAGRVAIPVVEVPVLALPRARLPGH